VPLVDSTYRAPPGFASGHLQSIVPSVLRRVPCVTPLRQRLETPDGDFLDVDRTPFVYPRLAILSHGLEGNSRQAYIQGMARALIARGWDVFAWNFRGCSGEPNRLLRFYHSGATEDLDVVVSYALSLPCYERIALVGFSLGGNLILKYLGEHADHLDPRVDAAVAMSAPCDLAASAARLAAPENRIYMRRFLRTIRRKIQEKSARFPGRISLEKLATSRTFAELDEHYTAPLHGFRGADDYWQKASSQPLLRQIRVPTLIVNAANDPFLAGGCFPYEEASSSASVYLETPSSGGHVGFITFNRQGELWSEQRCCAFLNAKGCP
jgi:uncharacterized protein